jgi:hypothetical protein
MEITDDSLPGSVELEEDEASKQDEPDAEPVLEHRRIFTDKLDLEVGALHSASKAGDLVLDPIFQELSRSLLNLAERDGTASYPQFTAMQGIPT